MIKIENARTFNIDGAIRSVHNQLNNSDISDSIECIPDICPHNSECNTRVLCNDLDIDFCVGENDFTLMKKSFNSGTYHRKYLSQICVCFDVTAPLYWWKEFDTYNVGAVANSCSIMDTINNKKFDIDDFSHECLDHIDLDRFCRTSTYEMLRKTVSVLNSCRDLYLQTKDKSYWWQMIQLLPSSYNQRRTITMNYENLVNIIEQKMNEQGEWKKFCQAMLRENPLLRELMRAEI